MHERVASPFTWTVHAPHCAMPHPYLVPARLRTSRRTQSSGISGSTSTLWARPFTFSCILVSPEWGSGDYRHGSLRIVGEVTGRSFVPGQRNLALEGEPQAPQQF